MKSLGLVSIDHKFLIQESLKTIHDPFSEQTFGNLFLYRHTHNFQLYQSYLKNWNLPKPTLEIQDHRSSPGYTQGDGNGLEFRDVDDGKTNSSDKIGIIQDAVFLCATGISYDHIPFLIPLGAYTDLPYLCSLAQEIHTECIYPIDEALWAHFVKQGHSTTSTPDDSDYLYERHQFETLSGKRLSKKKNLYHQFKDTYDWNLRPLDDSTLSDGHTILEKWYQDRPEVDDAEAMYDGLRFFDDLELQGWLVYVQNQPVGIYYGEMQRETFIVHCAKGLAHFKGLNAFVHIECSHHLPPHIRTLNWEQDLGLEGLRQAKYTFQPYLIRKKGRTTVVS